jgi:hypothetical protein
MLFPLRGEWYAIVAYERSERMSVKNSNRNHLMVWGGFLVAMAVVAVLSAGILRAGPSPEEKGVSTATDRAARQLARAKPTYVPG